MQPGETIQGEVRAKSAARVPEMDALRGMAAVAVVVIHATTPALHASAPGSGEFWLSLLLNQAARFAVPAFVLLSGMGLALSSAQGPGRTSFVRRAAKLLPLYVLWSVVYSVTGHAWSGKPLSALSMGRDLLTGSAQYHLYFVPMLLVLSMGFPYLAPLIRTRRGVFLGLAVTLAAVALRYYHAVPSTAFFLVKSVSPLPWLFYFALGAALAGRMVKLRALCWRYRRALVILCLAGIGFLALDVWMSGAAYGYLLDERITQVRPAVLPFAVLVVAWSFSRGWTGGIGRFLLRLQGPSYGIYLAHPLVIEALQRGGIRWGTAVAVVLLPVVLALSWALGTVTGRVTASASRCWTRGREPGRA